MEEQQQMRMTIPNSMGGYLDHLHRASATALIWSLFLFIPAVLGDELASKLFWLVAGIGVGSWILHAILALAVTGGDA